MADPKDQFVDVQGFKTRYWKIDNEGSPIVLLAGIGCSVLEWRNNIEALATSHRVYALDMLGHGKTEKRSHLSQKCWSKRFHYHARLVGFGPRTQTPAHFPGSATA